MSRILVMRHGHAEAVSLGGGDAQRALTAQGRQEVAAAALGLRGVGVELGCVLASPFVRTQQTAEAVVAAAFPGLLPQPAEALEAGCFAPECFEALRGASGASSLWVGHMPDVAYIIGYLTTGSMVGVAGFSPGAVACVEFPGSPRPGAGALRWMMTGEQLARLA